MDNYDLSTLETKSGQVFAINAFKNLLSNQGWVIYEAMLRNDMETYRNLIIEKINEDGGPATEQQLDLYRLLVKKISLYIDKPKQIIKEYTDIDDDFDNKEDPYDTVESIKKKKNIIKDSNK